MDTAKTPVAGVDRAAMATPAGAAAVAFPSEYERELAEVRARNAAALVSALECLHLTDPVHSTMSCRLPHACQRVLSCLYHVLSAGFKLAKTIQAVDSLCRLFLKVNVCV